MTIHALDITYLVAESGARAVGFDEDPWAVYPHAPRPARVSEVRAQLIRSRLAHEGRLRGGYLLAYHVTTADSIEGILRDGLVPGRQEAPGQPWKADHSDYATYFHLDREAALNDETGMNVVMDEGAAVIVAQIPITPKTLRRVLPDEDLSSDPRYGLKALLRGEAIAFIGGVPAGWVEENK